MSENDETARAYCVEDDCPDPATDRRLLGMVGDTPVFELVCARHADSAHIPEGAT